MYGDGKEDMFLTSLMLWSEDNKGQKTEPDQEKRTKWTSS